ncbi:MAG: LysM peptidoglycan-binding domain-containing protein [Candidatus Gracilibacteria bacterium]
MKKLLTSLAAITLFLSVSQTALAEFSVIPGPPHERQFNFEVQPGESIESSIIVRNLGRDDITVATYSADGTNSSQGTFALTSKSHEQKFLGTWVTFESPQTTIKAQDEVVIPFTLTIPANATPGNYGGGIAVEASSAELKGDDELSQAGAVSTSARIYIRTFVSVPGEAINDYSWEKFTFNGKSDNNRSQFHFSFKNNGNSIAIVEPKITLSGIPPLEKSELTLPQITLQPGTELNDIELRWDDQPSFGYYMATASVTFSEFDIARDEKINSTTQVRQIGINLTPWYITVILLGVLIILIGWAVYHNVTMKRLRSEWKSYKIKQGDTITSVSKEYEVEWKKLAKVNRLKKPYTLKSGNTILVPPKK